MMKAKFFAEFARALRNYRYERTRSGILFTAQKIVMGGVFEHQIDGGPWLADHNAYALEGLDAMMSCWFNNGSVPTAFYIAPFTNAVTPASSLTAATFASTLSEFTGYTESARQAWTPNGNASAQTMSNSNAPAVFTGGSTAATIRGGGLMTSAIKGDTTGVLVAAARFAADNPLNPGGTLKIKYTVQGTPAA
ncbi:hypothetical protein [Rhodanobacter lindaniclasticus]